MNTTDYFTYINAMFLFCIFTCGLLLAVGWQLSRKSGKLKKEQDSHLKATNTNTLLNKALSAKNAGLQANEHKLRDAEKEIRELQTKLDHAEADRIELRAERATLENKLTDALAKVRNLEKTCDNVWDTMWDALLFAAENMRIPNELRSRDDRGKYVKMNYRDVASAVLRYVQIDYDGDFNLTADRSVKKVKSAVNELTDAFDQIKDAQPKLIHGLTVKNPTEDEAKMIFDAARRLEIKTDNTIKDETYHSVIWYGMNRGISWGSDIPVKGETFVTAKEFVQRMQNGRG